MSSFPETPETLAAIKLVTERVAARLSRGEGPPVCAVPREKSAFPKLLCLDLNKWIDLGRAHFGRQGGEAFVDALAAIRTAIAAGRLLVPIMSSNLIEASEPNDQGRRERLAQFMVDLSRNHSFCKPSPVAELQVHRAIRELYLREEVGAFPREQLVGWGVEPALGMRWAGNELLVQAFAEPEISVLALVHAMDRQSIAEGRKLDERAAAVARSARAGGARPERASEELTNLFGSGTFADVLWKVIAGLGIDRALFEDWLSKNLKPFAAAIPDVDVELSVLLARDRNKDHPTHRNDLKDFIFLKVAVPYANIVVTENSWTHLIRAERLDEKYETTVFSDLRELPEQLKRLGCVN